MSHPIRSQGGHLVFPIGPQNTNLVEDVKIFLPVKLCWIPLTGFREEVKNVSANQRPGWPSCFSDRPDKHKLGRGHWDLASCQVSLNSVLLKRTLWNFIGHSVLFGESLHRTEVISALLWVYIVYIVLEATSDISARLQIGPITYLSCRSDGLMKLADTDIFLCAPEPKAQVHYCDHAL